MIVAVLGRHAGVPLGSADVFVNVAGGVRIDEPGADLAVALAIASAARAAPLRESVAAFGELGLTGRLRAAAQAERRLEECAKLGIAAVVAPEKFARALGLDHDAESVSAFGAREIAAGSGLLSPVRPGPWLWMRVGGDVMDLVALGKANTSSNPRRWVAAAAAAVVGGIVILDVILAAHATLHPHEDRVAAA
jgi:hypothetical protein